MFRVLMSKFRVTRAREEMTEKHAETNIQLANEKNDLVFDDSVQACHYRNHSADRFFEDLNKDHLSFKFTDTELDDLQSAVYELVVKILQLVETQEDRFKCSEIIKVGSFQEGTKIVEPNEFDFLAVIKELSDPCKVEAIHVCSNRPGYMHIRVKDKYLIHKWEDFIHKDDLLGFVHSNASIPWNSNRGLSSIIFSIYKSQRKDITVEKKSGILKFDGLSIDFEPNIQLTFTWNTKEREEPFIISVDVSPAVRCYNIRKAVTIDDCTDENIHKIVCDHESFLLTSGKKSQKSPSKCFRISLTEVEVKLVRKLSPTHKLCYRVLKFFFVNKCREFSDHGFVYTGLSSYCLKTAVLHHQLFCSNSIIGSVYSCTEAVISYLLHCLVKNDPWHPLLPSIFIKDHNLLESLACYQTDKTIALDLVFHVKCLTSWSSLTKALKGLQPTEYSFMKCWALLESTLSDMESAKQHIYAKAKQLTGNDGKWNFSDLSIENLLVQFDITYNTDT